MKTTIRSVKLLYLSLFLGLVGFWCSVAFADTPTVTSGWALTSLIPYVPLISALLGLTQAIITRELTIETGFWHTPLGHGLLTVFGVLIGAGMSFLANGQWTTQAAIAAATAAASAFAGAWKTGGKTATDSPASSVISQAKVFVPLTFALLFTIAGCKTTLGQCLIGGLAPTLETVVADVFAVIYNPSSAVTDIENLGTAPDVTCVVQAVEQYIVSKTAGPSGTVKPASLSPQYAHALEVLHGYMSKHPTVGCNPVDIKHVVERPRLVASL
jgi:hypothetical protein